jgi:hypothetical protein
MRKARLTIGQQKIFKETMKAHFLDKLIEVSAEEPGRRAN